MGIRLDLKETEHKYKGFEIKGRQMKTAGGYVLGGRHFIEGGIKRNYLIVKDGIQFYKGCVISTLKDAKEIVDELVKNVFIS